VQAEASPVCHSASCLQGGGRVRPSVWPSAGPDHSARCSSPLWPAGQIKSVRYVLNKSYSHSPRSTTHIVWDVGDGHEDSVSCSHRGQMQPQLQITDRVTAQVLQLKAQTRQDNALILPRFVCTPPLQSVGPSHFSDDNILGMTKEFIQMCHKRLLWLKDELIRCWWSKVKVIVTSQITFWPAF